MLFQVGVCMCVCACVCVREYDMRILGHDIKWSRSKKSDKHGIQGRVPNSGVSHIQEGNAHAEIIVDTWRGKEWLHFFHGDVSSGPSL